MSVAHLDRRLLAILAADVVGYTRLMERDEAGTIARLRAIRADLTDPLVAAHRGRIIKLMGDGAIVVFESVVEATSCAVAVQDAMAAHNAALPPDERIVFRIGINLDDVALLDGDVYGDGVNVAARLEQLCEPGGVLVSSNAYAHLLGKLAHPLEPAGEHKVKNLDRPIQAFRVRHGDKPRRAVRPPGRRPRTLVLGAALLLLLTLVGAFGVQRLWPVATAPTTRPGLAVLPFDNLGGDEATGRLADGLAEDVITDLARFRDLEVIARNSSFVYKGKPVDLRQVGRDLNVDYALEGSIQRQDAQVRITAQLIDTRSGAHVWSERWDRPVTDVFAVQSEIAERVAAKIGGYAGAVALEAQDGAKRKRPRDLTAYDLFQLGLEAKHRATREGLVEAIRLLNESVAIDPGFARAYTALAWAYDMQSGFVDDTPEQVAQRLALAQRAVALDPADAEAHAALASMLGNTGDLVRSEAENEKALALNPNSADILIFYALWASSYGKADKGVAAAEQSLRLNPNMPDWSLRAYRYAYFMAGRYADALRFMDRMPQEMLNRGDRVFRAAILAALGRDQDAQAEVAQTLALFPALTIEGFAVLDPGWAEAERQRLIETMRKAGFPACARADLFKDRPETRRLPECASA